MDWIVIVLFLLPIAYAVYSAYTESIPGTTQALPIEMWEINVSEQAGILRIARDKNSLSQGPWKGTLQFDLGRPIEIDEVKIFFNHIEFEAVGLYQGIIHDDRIIGIFTNRYVDYPWEARRTNSEEGLLDLGDYNSNGQVDNMGIVNYIWCGGFKALNLHTYRLCDNVYNPGGFDLLDQPVINAVTSPAMKWRFDGLPKVIDPALFAAYAIPPIAYPPEKIPTIRNLGRAFLAFPQDILRSALNGWTIDFSGIFGDDSITSEWDIIVNGRLGRLLIASTINNNGRMKFNVDSQWHVLHSVKKSDTLPAELDFRMPTLSIFYWGNPSEPEWHGTIYGHSSRGILGDTLSGELKTVTGKYSWVASGTLYDGQGKAPVTSDLMYFDRDSSGIADPSGSRTGTIKLRLGGGFIGRIYRSQQNAKDFDELYEKDMPLHTDKWQELSDISFTGNTIRFIRPDIAGNETYTGTVVDDDVFGTVRDPWGNTYNWKGTRNRGGGGTTCPGIVVNLSEIIGGVSNMIYYGAYSDSGALVEELAHVIKYAITGAVQPFTSDDQSAFSAVPFKGFFDLDILETLVAMDPQFRPEGYVSAYAARSADEDFANTVRAYVTDRPQLWKLVWEDSVSNNSDLLRKKVEFIRERVFHDAPIEGDWKIEANGRMGILCFIAVPVPTESTPTYIGTIHFDGGSIENLEVAEFNGIIIQFKRPWGGGVYEDYIGKLKGNSIQGFFVDRSGNSYSWNATSRST